MSRPNANDPIADIRTLNYLALYAALVGHFEYHRALLGNHLYGSQEHLTIRRAVRVFYSRSCERPRGTALERNQQDTGKLTRNVSHEGGQGEFYDSVLFFTNETRDCTIVRLPEVGVAIQFAMHRGALLANESDASLPSQYQYYLDWRKDGAANGPWTRFLDEWKALPTKFA